MKKVAGTIGWLLGLAGLCLLPAIHQARPASYFGSRMQSRPALTANLESSGRQYLLALDNNSDREFRGHVRVSLGQESEQLDAGQVAITLPPNGTKSLLLNVDNITGAHYTLQILDQKGTLVFYKVAPIRPVAGALLSGVETVSLAKVTAPNSPPTSTSLPVPTPSPPVPAPEVQIKPRLIAGAQDNDPFLLAFDIAATKAILNATLNLNLGKAKLSKPVSINKHAVVEFNLPDYLETNQLTYQLKRQDGSIVAEGSTDLDKLFADDHVTVADIRPDRVAYGPGETVRLIVALEGQSPHGFKLEVIARDYSGNTFFTNTVYGNPGETVKEKEFTFAMPGEVKGPVVFEFKVYDGETGLLFDSGERELTIKETRD
jgi:hypothetical protein